MMSIEASLLLCTHFYFSFFESCGGLLISFLFIPGRHFFIVAVVIILSDGFPLICVYLFCSI